MPAILNARNSALPWRRPVARALPIEPEAAIAPSIAFAVLSFFHSLCGQLVEAMTAMDAEVVKLQEIRIPGERIAAVIRVVAEVSGKTVLELVGDRRARELTRPRQIAMALCKDLTAHSLPVIGRHFGGRDHTTVMHAIRKVADLRAAGDAYTVALYDAAKARLG